MIVLYVILAVIAFILILLSFLLLSPMSVRVVYCDALEIFAGISFLKFRVYPKKQNKKKKRVSKVKKEPNQQKTVRKTETDGNKTTAPKEVPNSQKKPIKDTLSLIFDIVKSVCEMMGKKAKITISSLRVVVSKPDAADTAVQFGICNGIVISLLAFASNFKKAVISDKNVGASLDFVSGESTLDADITISAPVGSILRSIISGYMKNLFRK